jgi:hypothetical protein
VHVIGACSKNYTNRARKGEGIYPKRRKKKTSKKTEFFSFKNLKGSDLKKTSEPEVYNNK